MLKRKHMIAFFAFVFFMVGVHWYVVSTRIDPATGFYHTVDAVTRSFNIAMVALGAFGLLFLFFAPNKKSTATIELPRTAEYIFASSTIILSAFFIYNFICNKNVKMQFMPLGMASVPKPILENIPNLQPYFSLASGLVFLLQGVFLLFNMRDLLSLNIFKVAQVIPVFWTVFETIRICFAYTTVCYIIEHVIEVFAITFIMRTIHLQTFIFTLRKCSLNLVIMYIVGGLGAIFFGLMAIVPFYLNPVLQKLHSPYFSYQVEHLFFVLAVPYILSFLFFASVTKVES
ncbi:MAG: hypothetical protein LBJ38_02835, partial [Oscillospiraceae bacterium]|nr:hypothetical protein [Oscillospiraceae bacterium]